ncbi:MAG: mycofactocin biosynthesis glycosyltransferase MftF [Acidimicrobiales bacterium]
MSVERGDEGLPVGWSLTLDAGVRRLDNGRVLIGGSPLRILRLTPDGASWLDEILTGQQLPSSSAVRLLARRLVDAGMANPVPSPGGPTLGQVAVVVPVLDDPAGLKRTLATLGPVGEVVVVDDGSQDHAGIESIAVGATLLRNPRPLGPAAARERGWRAVSQPVVAFVDAGVVAAPGWLQPLLAHLGDPNIGAVAPRVKSSSGVAPGWLAAYERSRSSLDMGAVAGPIRPGSRVAYAPTAALVMRREALECVGGFDKDLRYGEDVDLVWRMHRSLWGVRYEPAAAVSHPCRDSLGAWIRQRARYGTSAAPLWRQHGSAVAPLHVSGWSALAWTAFALRRPVAGVAIAGGTTAALAWKLRGLTQPARSALLIAGKGNVWAGLSIAAAIRGPWWPPAVALAVGSRRLRPALVMAGVLPAIVNRESKPRSLDPVRFASLGLIDDLAYGAGVWLGCLRARSFGALLPSSPGLPPELRR